MGCPCDELLKRYALKVYGGVDFKISTDASEIRNSCHSAIPSSMQFFTLVIISQDFVLDGRRICKKKVKLSL
jgi:hypothetical protein